MKRLEKPGPLVIATGVLLTLAAAAQLIELVYIVLSPEGERYSIPPQVCFPPTILLVLLPPLMLITRFTALVVVMIVYTAIATVIAGATTLGLLADLITDPQVFDSSALMVYLAFTALMGTAVTSLICWLKA